MTDPKHEPRTIHAVKSGFTIPGTGHFFAGGRVLHKNETVTLTAEQVERTFDRNQESWLDLTDEQQIARWGELRFAHGPAPEGAVIGEGDVNGYRYRAWLRAVKHAELFSDPADRATELQKVAREFPEQRKGSSQHSTPYRD